MNTMIKVRKTVARWMLVMLAVAALALGLPFLAQNHVAHAATTQVAVGPCGYGCVYNIAWDGWRGGVTLDPQNGTSGTATFNLNNIQYQGRYVVSNPQNYTNGMYGAGYLGVPSSLNHRITLWADFNHTPSNLNDDQRFEGYLMPQQNGYPAFAGVTWWNNTPYGFYATFNSLVVG